MLELQPLNTYNILQHFMNLNVSSINFIYVIKDKNEPSIEGYQLK